MSTTQLPPLPDAVIGLPWRMNDVDGTVVSSVFTARQMRDYALAALSSVEGEPAAIVGSMPGTSGFTMACFEAAKVPLGTPVYTRPQPALADAAPGQHTLESLGYKVHEGGAITPDFGQADAAQAASQQPRPCHVFNVTKAGALTEWEPTSHAFALPDGKHALFTAPPASQEQVQQTAFSKALDIRAAQGWKLTGKAIPVLYTDTINGDQVMRDDVWLCTTDALKQAQQPAQAESCGLCGQAEAFTGTCGGGRDNPKALCFQGAQAEAGAVGEREVFEAWLRSVWTPGYACPKSADGEYTHGEAQRSWECWQARAALQSAQAVSQAARDVLAERQRQMDAEGWTPKHDDKHRDGSMALAAACYACNAAVWADRPASIKQDEYLRLANPGFRWPWAAKWWKPKNQRRDLIRACALLLAEIERLDRAALANTKEQQR